MEERAYRIMGPTRIPELDALRGVAVLLVLIYHLFSWSMGPDWSGFPKFIELVTRGGWIGVNLFFVISGFLITSLLVEVKDSKVYYSTFYLSRIFRILPLYVITVLTVYFFHGRNNGFLLVCFLFIPNFADCFEVPLFHGGLWSLGVEEHFYLIWPFLVRKLNERDLFRLCLGVCIATPFLRTVSFPSAGTSTHSWYRFDGMAYGAIIALSYIESNSTESLRRLRNIFIGFIASLLVLGIPFSVVSRHTRFGTGFQHTIIDLSFAAVLVSILLISKKPNAERPIIRFLCFFGSISYCLYLVHQPMLNFADRFQFWKFSSIHGFSLIVWRATVVAIASIGLSYLSRLFLEDPLLRFKRTLVEARKKEYSNPELDKDSNHVRKTG